MADLGASVLARLKRKAKERGKSLQLLLQLFCQEEFLRRLSRSEYADHLVLKGGMFIYALSNFESRSTIDVDFLLRRQLGAIGDIQKMVDEIISVDTGNSFVQLISQSYETISPQRKYKGVSFQLVGQIENTKTPFNVDVGIGDVIVPGPERLTIPVQLEGFIPAEILTYSLESTVAEKFEALIQRLQLTSRMKDIYDIYYLLNLFDFDGNRLQKAIRQTLTNRRTFYEDDSLDKVIALSNDREIQVRWRQFLHRTKLPELDLDYVFLGIEQFLQPIWTSIIQGESNDRTWSATTGTWE
ncbi:MAG: nucleotidyl transferase AbiEii/AbiGii toxin family protein [Chloroflexi bacterium]|jgi:predicted nucleotidyltransferase component of viral defense system|nr:nucleotidyl transferase AbiEii/AbiGii toxin family protein [Chloroflexota bacterium]